MIYVLISRSADANHWQFAQASADRDEILRRLREQQASEPTVEYRMQVVAPEVFEALTA